MSRHTGANRGLPELSKGVAVSLMTLPCGSEALTLVVSRWLLPYGGVAPSTLVNAPGIPSACQLALYVAAPPSADALAALCA